MSLDANISAFIGKIYESAYDHEAWDACAKELMRLTGAHFYFTHLFDTRDPESDKHVRLYGAEDSAMADGVAEYFAHFYRDDPALKFAMSHPGARMCETARLPPDESKPTQEYQKWMKSRFATKHWIVGYNTVDDGIVFGASLHPHYMDGPFSREKVELFRLLYDHMERALQLAARPPRLDLLDEALFYLDRSGRVQEVSPAAAALLKEADGLSMEQRRLKSACAADTLRLDRAILAAVSATLDGSSGQAIRLRRPSGKPDLLLITMPYPLSGPALGAFAPAAIVKILGRPKPALSPEAYSDLFAFTPREVQVAKELLEGHSLESMAVVLGMSRNTARNHLQSMFRKTRTNRQAELLRALMV